MVKALKFAAVSAIFVLPFTYSQSALAWNALSYEQAVSLCRMGDPRGCAAVRDYLASSPEVRQERRGPLSTSDFLRSW